MHNNAKHRDVFFVPPAAPQKYARVGGVINQGENRAMVRR